jgi:hypothetical protein
MFSLIYCVGGVYFLVGIYGATLILRGLKSIFCGQVTTTYHTVQASWREITFSERPFTLSGKQAAWWGLGQVVSGGLATVPWLLPLAWPMPLGWWLVIVPTSGVCLSMGISQIYGRRAAQGQTYR